MMTTIQHPFAPYSTMDGEDMMDVNTDAERNYPTTEDIDLDLDFDVVHEDGRDEEMEQDQDGTLDQYGIHLNAQIDLDDEMSEEVQEQRDDEMTDEVAQPVFEGIENTFLAHTDSIAEPVHEDIFLPELEAGSTNQDSNLQGNDEVRRDPSQHVLELGQGGSIDIPPDLTHRNSDGHLDPGQRTSEVQAGSNQDSERHDTSRSDGHNSDEPRGSDGFEQLKESDLQAFEVEENFTSTNAEQQHGDVLHEDDQVQGASHLVTEEATSARDSQSSEATGPTLSAVNRKGDDRDEKVPKEGSHEVPESGEENLQLARQNLIAESRAEMSQSDAAQEKEPRDEVKDEPKHEQENEREPKLLSHSQSLVDGHSEAELQGHYSAQGEAGSEEDDSKHRPYLHPVNVQYQGYQLLLFPPQEDHEQATYLLGDQTIAHESLDVLLSACKDLLKDSIKDGDEVIIEVPSLALRICEVSRNIRFLTNTDRM